MNRASGKVALITGAARGQGRSHAARLAEEGADIIAIDICSDVDGVDYPLATASDVDETIKLVEQLDRRIMFRLADVRDFTALEAIVAEGVAEFGHIDFACANAGICTTARAWEMTEQTWQTMIDINLTGVWKTVRAVAPAMIEQATGGSIAIVSSIAGLAAFPNMVHYNAAKHGLVGVMRGFAVELGQFNIRVNSVHPTNVETPMLLNNPPIQALMTGDVDAPRSAMTEALGGMHLFDLPWVDVSDVSNVILWLASDESRYITGTTQVIDAGATAPFKA